MDCLILIGAIFACMLVTSALPWVAQAVSALLHTTLGIMVFCLCCLLALSVVLHVI